MPSNRKPSAPLKWPGGKTPLARLVWDLAPRHRTYLEPYAGGLSVLLARDPADPKYFLSASRDDAGVSEVVCDADGELTLFWRVMADPALFKLFARRVAAVPFSQAAFDEAVAASDRFRAAPPAAPGPAAAAAAAAAFFVRCRQSMMGLGRSFAPTSRARVRRGMNEQASAWLSAVDGLAAAHARLARVAVRTGPAVPLLREFDDPSVFAYLDPPYPHDTRPADDLYRFEMTAADHAELLAALATTRAKVIVSSSPNAAYDAALAGWRRVVVDRPNSMSKAAAKAVRREVLYLNYEAPL